MFPGTATRDFWRIGHFQSLLLTFSANKRYISYPGADFSWTWTNLGPRHILDLTYPIPGHIEPGLLLDLTYLVPGHIQDLTYPVPGHIDLTSPAPVLRRDWKRLT